MDCLGFGVWALVGFQFWDMETVMCYPFCIREFMVICFERLSTFGLFV